MVLRSRGGSNMWTRLGLLLMVIVGLTACASGGGATSRSGSLSVLGEDELSGVPELNAYEAVRRLRPQWLVLRGSASFTATEGIRLYVDGVERGYASSDLASIRASSVSSMRFLSGREATARFGTDHGNGAILVTLR